MGNNPQSKSPAGNCGVVILSLHQPVGSILWANSDYCEMLGYGQKEFLNSIFCNGTRLVFSEGVEAISNSILTQTAATQKAEFDAVTFTRTGTPITLRYYGTVENDADGISVLRAVAFKVDKLSESSFDLLSPDALNSLFGKYTVGVFTYNMDNPGHVEYINDAMLDFLGCSREQFAEKYKNSIYNAIDVPDASSLRRHGEDSPVVGDYTVNTYTGEKISVTAQKMILRRPDGNLYALIYVNRNNKESGSAINPGGVVPNAASDNYAETYKALINTLPCGVFQYYPADNTVRNVSSGLFTMLGYSAKDAEKYDFTAKRATVTGIIHKDDIAEISKEVAAQVAAKKPIRLEFRLRCRDASYIWARISGNRFTDENGEVVYPCTINDISDIKLSQSQTEYEKERYIILLNCVDEMVFEYDPENDVCVVFPKNPNGEHRQLLTQTIKDYKNFLLGEENLVYPDDKHLLDDLFAGRSLAPVDVRMQHLMGPKGVYFWTEVRGTAIEYGDKTHTHVVGLMRDIDARKRAAEVLLYKSERDLLTQLYNKVSATVTISDFLNNTDSSAIHAMFVIDIDDFKDANDMYGHQFGDTVLIELSRILRELFRTNDIIGRTGGDEFVVLMKDILDPEIVTERAKEINARVSNFTFEKHPEYHFSVSIGVSLFPQHGKTFEELFNNADLGLYESKIKGKKRYAVYSERFNGPKNRFKSGDSVMPSKMEVNDSFRILNTLIDTLIMPESRQNADAAAYEFLKIIGSNMDVGRCYVYIPFNNKWIEWCSGTYRKRHTDGRHFTIDDFSKLEQFKDPDCGVIAINHFKDIKHILPQMYKSLSENSTFATAQLPIPYGDTNYIFGFDECEIPRLWTKTELLLIASAAKLLTSFLNERREFF